MGLSLLDILVFRFLMRVAVLETLGWLAFAFLQVTSLGSKSSIFPAWQYAELPASC